MANGTAGMGTPRYGGLQETRIHALAPLRADDNAQRSDAGWATARDRFPGRVVERRPVVGMAPPYMLDTVVNRRATGPDPRR